ncbi:hypothetical protein BJF89_16065 [Corynebacterium sp. CNJ-954]|uniref:hypothetical protein n=1 Tax=Corynebacterium sp. CNJ-954 TaxID=1904962 RepID=UPI0009608636|nr:hypothetical protein [Corynebacterium sp. CNJ-954]OLT55269.1 hypothetical protein BJF89_16065 [Corynebacterium sp. CNJ-954]
MLQPTEGTIFFAEYDVMKSVSNWLNTAYFNLQRAATTDAERQWWIARHAALREYVAAAVDTDREDLLSRTRTMRAEFDRLGGLNSPGRD